MTTKGLGDKYPNQRKIFKDSSKNLNINDESKINFPVCGMDLLFWMNIKDLGEKVEYISENTSLERFNVIYGGLSLLHHFADNQEVIEMICELYKQAKEDDNLT